MPSAMSSSWFLQLPRAFPEASTGLKLSKLLLPRERTSTPGRHSLLAIVCQGLGLRAAVLLLLSSFLVATALAQDDRGRVECSSVPSKILGRAIPYCILLPPAYDADA